MVMRVRTRRQKWTLPRIPRDPQDLSKLHERGRQHEGEDKRSQQLPMLHHQPAPLLENPRHSPSPQPIRIPLHHRDQSLNLHIPNPNTRNLSKKPLKAQKLKNHLQNPKPRISPNCNSKPHSSQNTQLNPMHITAHKHNFQHPQTSKINHPHRPPTQTPAISHHTTSK
ncbi:hypothetical protein M758_8G172800 [Ceratodon purpureus]|nr:hypothetical protein M758_8G172800 [Ceratodon purpureus]